MTPPITPLTPAQIALYRLQAAHDNYPRRVLVAFDVFANVLLNGQPGETISSHAARAALKGKLWGTVLSKLLDLIQHDHGAIAIVADLERAENIERIEEPVCAVANQSPQP